MSAHYFQPRSMYFRGNERLCGECDSTYPEGDHIEVNDLKPYTSYVCPTGGGLGHSSQYTGAYLHVLRSPRDKFCICGAELVEEDNEQWRLSWEMDTGTDWRPVTKVGSKHATHQQRDGLEELIARGEPVRAVTLERVSA